MYNLMYNVSFVYSPPALEGESVNIQFTMIIDLFIPRLRRGSE